MSEKPIIEVENLSFTYHPPEWIFENLNFTIYSGEICALVGPSGTGKTTLGYILKGLIPHAIKGTLKGNVIVAGLDLQKASFVTTAKSIGMVFQDLNAQLFNLTVQEEIEFGLTKSPTSARMGKRSHEFIKFGRISPTKSIEFIGWTETTGDFGINYCNSSPCAYSG